MKNNQIIFFPALLGLPTLGLFNYGSPDTIALGVISFTLLFLFFYTIKLMGGKPENEQEKAEFAHLENPEEVAMANVPEIQTYRETTKNKPVSVSTTPIPEPTSKPINKTEINTTHNPLDIQGFRRDRFKKETLGPMVKIFLQDLPGRSKIDNILFSVYEKENYHEFLIQRGRLFIDCDTDAYIDASDETTLELKEGKNLIEDQGRRILLPIFTPSKNYGALILESLSGFNEKDLLIYQSECNRFAFEWEMRTEYELAILDPITLVYNKSHFRTIIREKFLSHEKIGLFFLEITGSEDRDSFISFLAEYLSFPLYRVEEKRLAFFLEEEEINGLNINLESAIKELDLQKFYAEFILAYSIRRPEMYSVMDWEEDTIQQLYLARKKSPQMAAIS
ncbi:MAG: hypothetical protein JJT78_18485 [Leptospira sp.]|nr:hypothetical protein [Leptospira sp.]